MADKKIKVQVDVQTDVEPSIAALKALKKQLKETAAGSEEFIALQRQIDDVQDSLVAARAGAGNFGDILGTLPGPIGAIGGQLGGTLQTLKQFSALKLTNIQGSFVELGNDIVDTAKGLGELTGITKVYTIINTALARSFTAIGIAEGTAAAGATAFATALTATGIGAIVVAIGLAVSALSEMASELYKTATGEAALEKAVAQTNSAIERQNRLFDLNAKSAENRRKVTIAQMRAQGKTESEIRKYGIDQSYSDYQAAFAAEQEAVKLYNQQIGKVDAAGLKTLQENLDKRQQATKDTYASYLETGYNAKAEEIKLEESKNKELAGKSKAASDKRIADRKKELEDLRKGLEDARLETLSARDKEESVVNKKYDDLKALAVKYGEDTKVIEQARATDLGEIADKYAKEDKDKADKVLQDKLNSETLALDLRLAKGEIDETEYQNKLYEIRKQYAISNDELVKAEIDSEKYKTEQKKLSAEEERGILLSNLQSKFEALDAENQRLDLDFEADLARLAEQRTILAEQEAIDLANEDLTEFQKTEIRKKYADQRKSIVDSEIATEKAAAAAKHEINMAYLGLFEQFGNLLGQIAGKNKALAIAGIVISQAASIGQIIANTAIANAKSIAASPLTFGQPWVAINTISAGLSIASTIAGAAKSIAQINAQPGGSGGSSSAGATGGSSSAQLPKPPTVSGAAAPQIQSGQGINASTQIAQTIGASQKPIKAYVVSGDVSSQQALDRRTSRAATFTGG
jgi:hypothetical protein